MQTGRPRCPKWMARGVGVGMAIGALGALGALALTGCSSGGTVPVDYFDTMPTPLPSPSPTPTPTPTPSPSPAPFALAGDWSGPYTLSNGRAGLAGVTIGADGSLNGTVISTSSDSTQGQQGTVTGTVNAQGFADLTFRDDGGRVTFQGTGVLEINSAGQLTGTLTRLVNGAPAGSATVTLNRGKLTS